MYHSRTPLSMSALSKEEAREFIALVREDNGGVSKEDEEFLIANRPSVLRALHKTRMKLANAMTTVVEGLYSKETRFLYELIQNAEDNSYSRAIEDGEDPYLAFKIYPEKVIVDSNEDGFSKENISAICSVGDSTKKHSAGYIGEKGIGFKSVFKIARKVHIQSGPFSFVFSHTQNDNDNGLGLITPYDEEHEPLPTGVRTRMTLTLLDCIKHEELASEFRHVPDTFLMFLSRLKRLSFELCPPNNAVFRYSKRETNQNGIYTTFLTKTARTGEEESTSEQKYYTMKTELHGLPSDMQRVDKKGNSIDRATVILAFPVDPHDEPVIKQQYTYAFLPLRRLGFKFLIQSDFITQANREDVNHSKRNEAVLGGVAEAFANAMVVFSKRPSLRYKWMRYLPDESISDQFWLKLCHRIREKLKETPLLEPWSGSGLYKPSDLEKLPPMCLDQDGSPLLSDHEGKEIYLSEKYTWSDFEILKQLGTRIIQWGRLLDRLEIDVNKVSHSKWRNMEQDADWCTRMCKLLLTMFDMKFFDQQNRLKTLRLIPLTDSRWVPTSSGSRIYFPKTDQIPIPPDLGLDLVAPTTTGNNDWVLLLSTLGVVECPQDVVISSIYKRYQATNVNNFSVRNAVAHLRYLYWFLPEGKLSLDSQVRLANQYGTLLRTDQYLYFPDERDDYSPSKLFKQNDQVPGCPVNYLNTDYLGAEQHETVHNGRSWLKWLEVILRVRQLPELRLQGCNGLSREFEHIAKHHSNKLLETLRRGWAFYCTLAVNMTKQELQNSAVLLENGSKRLLHETFLPFPQLKHIATEFGIAGAYPFVAMSEALRDEDKLRWIFVKDLGVGFEDDLEFYFSALETFKTLHPSPNASEVKDQLIGIYKGIQSKCSGNLDDVRDMFKQRFIWIPSSTGTEPAWLSTAACVWDGPPWLTSKQCLKLDIYAELDFLFTVALKIPNASKMDVASDLIMLKYQHELRNVLRSQQCASSQPSGGSTGPSYQATISAEGSDRVTYQSINFMPAYQGRSFEEIRLEQDNTGKVSGKIASQTKHKAFVGLGIDRIYEEAEKRYSYIWHQSSASFGQSEEIRRLFEESALVYVSKEDAWFSPSQCVWVKSSVKIPGKASIAETFPTKKTFFTTILKVSEPTVGLYIESLRAEAGGSPSASQIKATMALICGLGVAQNDLSSLIGIKFLPVKLALGTSTFTSTSPGPFSSDFAIVDNINHWNAFKGKIDALDFTLEEIRDTRPLLLALGLEKKFSSRLVKGITDVRGGSQDCEMTKKLRMKSQSITRCVTHFASMSQKQDLCPLYLKFKRGRVYVSDSIRLSLQIPQGGRTIEGAPSRANFHLEDVDGALRLYLPKDEVEKDVCFESDLPRSFCKFFNITDLGAPAVIGGVFRKDNPLVIDQILKNAGVSQVDCDFAVPDEESGSTDHESDTETLVEPISNVRLSTPDPTNPRPYTPSNGSKLRFQQFGSVAAEAVRVDFALNQSHQDRQREVQVPAYKRILENVVNLARQRVRSGDLEAMGLSAPESGVTEALPQEIIREAFGTRTQERDFKVGAAGELYMFEYMKGLELSGFGTGCWKSAIRDRVNIHPDYQGLEKDNNRSAIADIEYWDVSSKFTQFLIGKGLLSQRLWDKKMPYYYIEVKTTVSSDWQEPFFMSKAQERHIQEKRITTGDGGAMCVYLICRLFNLGKGHETGLHIYLDPETKRRNGELEFSTHTWAVRPLIHLTMAGEAHSEASAT